MSEILPSRYYANTSSHYLWDWSTLDLLSTCYYYAISDRNKNTVINNKKLILKNISLFTLYLILDGATAAITEHALVNKIVLYVSFTFFLHFIKNSPSLLVSKETMHNSYFPVSYSYNLLYQYVYVS